MSDLNFLFEVPPPAEDLPKMEPGFVDNPRLSPLFIKPQRPESKKTSVEDRSLEKPSKHLYRFGVVVEDFSAELVAEVVRDIIALVGSLPSTSRLVVVSPSSGEFWTKLTSTLPIDLQLGNFDSVKVWKVYWKTTKPNPPPGVRFTFEKRVGNPGVRRIVLRPAMDTATTPVNPDANRMLPAGQSPSYSRRPTMMAPVQMTPQLYLWSGSIPLLTCPE